MYKILIQPCLVCNSRVFEHAYFSSNSFFPFISILCYFCKGQKKTSKKKMEFFCPNRAVAFFTSTLSCFVLKSQHQEIVDKNKLDASIERVKFSRILLLTSHTILARRLDLWTKHCRNCYLLPSSRHFRVIRVFILCRKRRDKGASVHSNK